MSVDDVFNIHTFDFHSKLKRFLLDRKNRYLRQIGKYEKNATALEIHFAGKPGKWAQSYKTLIWAPKFINLTEQIV